MVFVYKKLAQFAVRCALPPRRSESPVCSTDNIPSCVLHLLGWFIGSRGFWNTRHWNVPWNEGPNFGSYRLSVVQGSALVLCVNSQLCAHICVILMLPEVSRTKISTQPKLTHSHTCFNSGGNEETMWYILKHWSENMTQDSRELLEQLWRGRIQRKRNQEPEV